MYDEDREFVTGVAVCGVIAAVISGCVNLTELEQDKRVELLNQSAKAGCEQAAKEGYVDKYITPACITAFTQVSQGMEDSDIIGRREMNDSEFKTLRAQFQDEAYTLAIKETIDRKNYIRAEHKLNQALWNLEISGAKLYENASVGVYFESITSFKNAQKQDVITGKWSVVIQDTNSGAERTFLYDYATGKATGPSGTSSGQSDFWFRYSGVDSRYMTSIGRSSSKVENIGDVQDCRQVAAEISCKVAEAVHKVLNTKNGLTADEIASYQRAIKETYQNDGAPDYKKRLLNFYSPVVVSTRHNFGYNWN